MELALYCPVYGYYEKEADTVGRRGDFYTSVSVGSLFGELLAFQFADWFEQDEASHGDPTGQLLLVEAGAHDGRLAADVLAWLRHWRPKLFQRIEYRIIESSAVRRGWQAITLANFTEKVRWPNVLESKVQ